VRKLTENLSASSWALTILFACKEVNMATMRFSFFKLSSEDMPEFSFTANIH
jgi:hypothetical protein